KNANDTVPLARKALDEITVASRNWGQVGERANVLLRTNEDQINSIVKNLDKVMGGLAEVLKQDNLNDVATLLRNLAEASRRFLTDPSLYNHLDDTALMLTRIIPRLDRVLHDFEVFADKLARHPEALGLGGVVRPSSGLKEPPSQPYYPKRHP